MVPTGMPREKLEELTRANVRFLQVNMEILQSYDREYGAKGDYRGDFQRDTYVIMRLLRRVGEEDLARSEGEDVFEVSPVYRLLYFYLRSHFAFSEDIVIGDYINAVVHGDVARLIKGCLVLRPAERYQEVSYELVTQAAIRA